MNKFIDWTLAGMALAVAAVYLLLALVLANAGYSSSNSAFLPMGFLARVVCLGGASGCLFIAIALAARIARFVRNG